MTKRPPVIAIVLTLWLAVPPLAWGRDFALYPVGKPEIVHGLEVGAVYFQPIDLQGAMMHASAGTDIHLEADVHAAGDDADGYAEGEWRPYLTVTYRLTRTDTGQTLAGALMPLVAYGGSGGGNGKPHYGDNLKLMGMGRYRLELTVAPPPGQSDIGGFQPFTVERSFVFAGIGKKGAY